MSLNDSSHLSLPSASLQTHIPTFHPSWWRHTGSGGHWPDWPQSDPGGGSPPGGVQRVTDEVKVQVKGRAFPWVYKKSCGMPWHFTTIQHLSLFFFLVLFFSNQINVCISKFWPELFTIGFFFLHLLGTLRRSTKYQIKRFTTLTNDVAYAFLKESNETTIVSLREVYLYSMRNLWFKMNLKSTIVFWVLFLLHQIQSGCMSE